MAFPILTAQEAADIIKNGDNLGFSGFTAAGTPKVVAEALAVKAEREHAEGRPFKVNIFTGASTSDHIDGSLARANAVNMRTPYQSCPDMRKRLNAHDAHYFDIHLSELAQKLRYGTFGDIDVAIIEAAHVNDDGSMLLGYGLGMTPTVAQMAKKIIVEVNEAISPEVEGLHDIYIPLDPPYRREIPVYKPSDRIGSTLLKVDPSKIVGIVKTNLKDGVHGFSPLDDVTKQIGANVCDLSANSVAVRYLRRSFLSKAAWAISPMPSCSDWANQTKYLHSTCTPKSYRMPS